MPVILTVTSDLGVELDKLVALLQRCVGPNGKLHMLCSVTGHTSVTSLSSRLCSELQRNAAHPVLTFLLNSAQAQNQRFKDAGLWTCICAGILLRGILKFGKADLIYDLCSYGLSMLRHTAVRVNVSLDSVRPLLLTAQSVLRSKSGAFGAASSDVSSVAFAVVKAFIETSGVTGNLVVLSETGSGEPRVLPGLLWRSMGEEVAIVHGAKWENASVIIVTTMLTDIKDPSEKVEKDVEIERDPERKLADALRLVNLVLEAGIRVVACQKVVHPKIKLIARRSGLLILSRLGRQFVYRLELISRAKPIRDCTAVSNESLVRCQGRLKNVTHEIVSGKDYLVLGGEVFTLLLHAPTSEVSTELSAAVNQALGALACVARDKFVVPGAGCIEVWLCAQLWGKVISNRNSYSATQWSNLLSTLRSVQLALLSAAGMNSWTNSLYIDSQRQHAWESSLQCSEPREYCRCGLLSVRSVGLSSQWTLVNWTGSRPLVDQWSSSSLEACPQLSQNLRDVVLDVYSAKENAFRLAVDTATTLASVGATLLPADS